MIKTILTMYIIHIAGMVLCVGKEFYVIQILELFYVEIIIFPVIFDGQTPMCKNFRLNLCRDYFLFGFFLWSDPNR